ncbi:hypothetical protein D1007_00910 [Hordeum vulgare]|nr:hypothetical protein D1007_00910 [Hordeum vulgare]
MEWSEWMGDQTSSRYVDGTIEFMAFAEGTKRRIGKEDYIMCPCKDCTNAVSLPIGEVEFELYKRGFMGAYTRWTGHSEELVMDEGNNLHVGEVPNRDLSRIDVEFNLGDQKSSYKWKTGMPNLPKKKQECEADDTDLNDMPDFAAMIAGFEG